MLNEDKCVVLKFGAHGCRKRTLYWDILTFEKSYLARQQIISEGHSSLEAFTFIWYFVSIIENVSEKPPKPS